MARIVRNQVGSRSQRLKLTPRKEPYWTVIERGLSLGYHRSPRGAGGWWARVIVERKYRSGAIGTADDHEGADGERYLDFGQAQREARAWADRQTGAGPLTVAKACERYVEAMRAAKGERAAYHANSVVKRHILPKLGEKRIADLTTDEVRRWRDGLVKLAGDEFDQEDERRSRDTANRILTVLKAAMNRIFSDGVVRDDRAWRSVRAFKAVGEARQALLTTAEMQRLVDCCPAGLRELVAAGAYTGARLGELTSAKVRDLDVKGRTLSVRGKTGPRVVHLDVGALALFTRLAKCRAPTDPLLRTTQGNAWAASRHLGPVAAAVASARLDPGVTFYALRHSYITHALNAGVPLKAVAEHCGTSVIMISRTYAKVLAGHHARYAAMAAPTLELDRSGGNVVSMSSPRAAQ